MARYKRANQYPLTQQQKEAVRYHRLYQSGQMNDMKYILLRDMQTFASYMGIYNLEKGLYNFMTVHEVAVFGYTFCSTENAPMCGQYYASKLKGRMEDPEHPSLTEKEALLQEYARALAEDFHHVPEELYSRMNAQYKEDEMIRLIAYAGLLLSSCMFENAVIAEPEQQGDESSE